MKNSQTNSSLPKLTYNRIEAGEILGLSPSTIDRITKDGLLKPNRATRRPLYSLGELQRFAEAPSAKVGRS